MNPQKAARKAERQKLLDAFNRAKTIAEAARAARQLEAFDKEEHR